ncbi:MAG: hypothetical protein JKX94_02885 [Sneathiella sp.]|nr:hypothetical protein [Sneathiella sp.]
MVVFTAFFLLAACTTAPQKQVYADITFQHLSPIKLDVGEIKIVNEFKPSLKSPHVEHELPVKIDQSVQRWVRDRLEAVGGSGAYAVLTIKDASAVEVSLDKTKGLKGVFTKDQSELYTFHIAVELQVVDINGSKGLATAEVRRSKSVPEDITLNNREKMYFELTEILMQDFDVEMEKNIRAFLKDFIR